MQHRLHIFATTAERAPGRRARCPHPSRVPFANDVENPRCLRLPLRACSRSTAASGWSHPELKNPELVPARGRLTETPVTGDWVALDEGGAIAAIEPRHGTIVRRAPGAATTGQVLAANVDLALVTEPLPGPQGAPARALRRARGLRRRAGRARADQGRPRRGRLRRPPRGSARRLGVADAVAVSAAHRRGHGHPAPAAHARARPRVLLGASGTGKSTLVNALLGEERQKTGEVRASDGRGRHTTVTRELLTAPERRAPDRHARHPDRRPVGRHRRDLRRRRRARAAVPLRGLRPRHRAGLRRPRTRSTRSGSPPGASCSASWRGSRTAAPPPRRAKQSGARSPANHTRSGGGADDESGRGESNPHLWLGKPTS